MAARPSAEDKRLEARLREELAPEFEVVRALGTGKMATVYLARQPTLKRLVAIKVPFTRVVRDEVARKRFEREGQAAAQISHANVVSVFQVGALSDGHPYIVMEYVEGRNLEDLVRAEGPLEEQEARRMIIGVAQALSAAHEQGLIHRDVRPANVIRESRSGRAVLTDFGIVGLQERGISDETPLTRAGQRVGDLRHMSPEQLGGEPLTVQADIYGLGILGYELLTGEGPYGSGSLHEIIQAHLHKPPLDLRQLRPGIDERMANVLSRCLTKRPEQRPTARDIRRLLEGPENVPPPPELDPSPLPPAFQSFLGELKRRRVIRFGVWYLAAVFVVFNGVDLLPPALSLPEWAQDTLAALLLGLFPVLVVLVWIFDFTQAGIQRTAALEDDPGLVMTRRTLQGTGLLVAIVLAGLIGWLILGGG